MVCFYGLRLNLEFGQNCEIWHEVCFRQPKVYSMTYNRKNNSRRLFVNCLHKVNSMFSRDYFVRDCLVCFFRIILSWTVLYGNTLLFVTILSEIILSVH